MDAFAWCVVGTVVVFGWAGWTAWQRHREFRLEPGTFPCRVRARSAPLMSFPVRWTRGRCEARWVHDVLVVRRGLLMPRLYPLAVRVAKGDLVELDRRRVRWLGATPVRARLVLDDGSVLEIAARGQDQALLAGPYLVLAVRPPRPVVAQAHPWRARRRGSPPGTVGPTR